MMIKKRNILLWLTAPMLLVGGCTDNTNVEEPSASANGEENVVTFTVKTQPQTIATRSEGEETKDRHISDGLGVDVLVFAVYVSDDNISYKLDETFQKEGLEKLNKVVRGKGQNLITNVDPMFYNGLQIQLIIDPEKYYKVVFWAQDSNFPFYDTTNLANVKVDYSGVSLDDDDVDSGFGVFGNSAQANNNDNGDAFCAMKQLSPGSTGRQEVILRRPFSQINVATSGWDFEGSALLNPAKTKYMESEIVVSGVALAYTVLDGEAITTDEDGNPLLGEVHFTYNYMPAYYQYLVENREGDIATAPAEHIYKALDGRYPDDELLKVKRVDFSLVDYDFNLMSDGKYYDYLTWHRFFNFKGALSDNETDPLYNEVDQFNKKYYIIHTDEYGVEHIEEVEVDTSDEAFNPDDYYTTSQLFEYIDENNKEKPKKISTEIYKYLSMCYVFVPSKYDEEDKPTNSTVDVHFRFRGKGIDETTGAATGAVKETEWFDVLNVPVQKNWRTNIIGDGFFMVNQKFNFYVIPDYCGEYDYLKDEDKEDPDSWHWDMEWNNQNKDDWWLEKGGYIYDGAQTSKEWWKKWYDKELNMNKTKD